MNSLVVDKEDVSTTEHIDSQLDYANQYVSFWIDRQLLGIQVGSVQEILNPQSVSSVPKARSEIAGLLNLRGQIVTAINLRRRLKLPQVKKTEECMNVVIRYNKESYSLLVDQVGDVINVGSYTMKTVPHNLDPHWKAVTHGVFQLEEQLFVILDIDALLTMN